MTDLYNDKDDFPTLYYPDLYLTVVQFPFFVVEKLFVDMIEFVVHPQTIERQMEYYISSMGRHNSLLETLVSSKYLVLISMD